MEWIKLIGILVILSAFAETRHDRRCSDRRISNRISFGDRFY